MEKELHSKGARFPISQGQKRPINQITLQLIIAMKIFLLFLAISLQVSAAALSQQITLSVKKAPLREVMQLISKQSGYNFLFRSADTKKANPVTVTLHLLSIQDALEQIFEGQPFTYTIDNKIIVITKKKEMPPATLASPDVEPIIIKGKVTDKKKQPLPGVSVRIKGAGIGTVTDEKGNYSLKTTGPGILLFTYLGYRSVEKEFNDRTEFNVSLEDISSQLDQVQIIAYGTTTRRYSTSNITSISGDEISKQPVSNLLLAMQGKVPGLFLNQTSGVAGSDVKLRVQGENSLRNGNEAFYVIDGIPYTPQNLYTGINGQSMPGPGSALSFINPADVESIEVLKDADATAIYGSRAANGAILITTKRGKPGMTKVDLNVQTGWGAVPRKVKLLNTDQYFEIRKEAIKNADQTIGSTDYDLNGAWDPKKNTDWQKELIGNATRYTTAQGTISGGNSQTQFLAGIGYIKETSVFSSKFDDTKGNVHLNINHKSQDTKFNFSISTNYLHDVNTLPLSDLTSNAITLAPNAPNLYNKDGSINWQPLPNSPNTYTFTSNPAAILLRKYKATSDNFLANMTIGYEVLPNLTFKTSFGYNQLTTDELATLPQISFYPTPVNLRSATYGNKKITSWIIEPQLTYNKEFSFGKLDMLLGSSFQSTDKSVQAYRGTNFANDDQLDNSLAAGMLTADYSTMRSQYRYNALFGRINYQLQNRYILNLSARRDGSSRFGSANLFNNFYSVGGAWIFSEENWLKEKVNWFSFGKIRLTYGTTGNDQIQDYQFLNLYSTYNVGVAIPYQQVVGLIPMGHSNPYLQWEETRKINVGLDLGFIDNKIIANINRYRNRSSNQLLDYNLPNITGFPSVLRNIPALVENSGWEVIINGKAMEKKEFNWDISANVTFPKNKLIDYPGLSLSSSRDTYVIGQSTNIFKAFEFAGVNKETGYYEFKTADGKVTSDPDSQKDKTKIITLGPTIYGGLSNNMKFKNFELSFLLQYTKQMSANYKVGNYFPGFANSNQPTDILQRWQKPGDNTSIQKVDASYNSFTSFINAKLSDLSFSDASFIRLKNVSVSYLFPTSWLKKARMSFARIYIQGQNLATFTKFKWGDPETGTPSVLPPLRIITTGIQLTF